MIDVRIVFQLKSTGNVVTNAWVEKYIKTITKDINFKMGLMDAYAALWC